MKKTFKNKLLLGGTLLTTTFSTLAFAISCGSNNTTNLSAEIFTKMSADEGVAKLKTTLAGYSTDEMEILANKQEITKQSEELIEAFNKFYGTKLKFTQIGGSTDYGQYLSTKFTNGVGKLLLVSAGSKSAFENINNHLIDTPASKMLENDSTSDGEFVVGEKHFMSATREAIGVIYSKTLFARAQINVFEGKSFDEVTTKPSTLAKPTDGTYNGTIKDGEKLYVFTDDLKLEGYKAIVAQLEAKGIKPFYTTSKTTSGNIWPLTNHLLGSAVNAVAGLQPNDEKLSNNPEQIFTSEVMEAMKNALEIYGHNKNYNKADNTVDLAMQNVALDQYAMSQNGTWATPQLVKAAKDKLNVGFLPMPIFNKDDQTAMFFRTVSQRWAATTLANDAAKLKTAQLFLRFLYQTKTGIETISNDLQLFTPFKKIEGMGDLDLKDPLAKSQFNYTGSDLGEPVDNYFVNGFNNSSEKLVEVTNGGYTNTEEAKTKLIAEFTRLKTPKSGTQE